MRIFSSVVLFVSIFVFLSCNLERNNPPKLLPSPFNLRIIAGNQSLDLSWEAPENPKNEKWSYEVYHNEEENNTSGGQLVTLGERAETNYRIKDLNDDTLYYVWVRVVFNKEKSPWSKMAQGKTLLSTGVLGSPSNLSLSPSDGQLEASWDAPTTSSDGILSYELSYSTEDNLTNRISISSSEITGTRHPITGLTNDTRYYVWVRAVLDGQEGPWSESVEATPFAAPSAPGNLSLIPSDGQLEASWDAPTTSSDGILSYELSYSTEDNLTNRISISSSEITGTRHPITGLTNDTRYYVWVRAVLDEQEGPWSASAEATPFAAPSAPSNLSLSPSDGQLEASWDAPTTSSDGILSYELSYSTEDNLTNRISISSSEITGTRHPITGLTNDTRYYVWVRAVLDGQEGPWSESVEATPFAAPSAPGNLSLIPSDGQLEASWDAPTTSSDGILSYELSYSTEDNLTNRISISSSEITGTRHPITGLTNDTLYYVWVRAVLDEQEGPWSASAEATPFAAPSAPSNLSLSPSDGQLEASWDAPTTSSDGILSYELSYSTEDNLTNRISISSSEITGTRHPITGLTNDTRYYVWVRAVLDGQEGPWSESVEATPFAAPSAPGNLSLIPSDGQLEASWDAPTTSSDGILSYELSYSTEDNLTNRISISSSEITGTRHPITGLTNDTRYYVWVRAVLDEQEGPWSASAEATPFAAPSAPSNLSLSPSDGQLEASWDALTAPNNRTLVYELSYSIINDVSSSSASTIRITGTRHPITGLTNDTRYYVWVRAVLDGQEGPWSESVEATPFAAPSAPGNLSLIPSDGQLEASWDAPTTSSDGILSYELSYSTEDNLTNGISISSSEITGTRHPITGLTNDTRYYVWVRAVLDGQEGPWSESVEATPFAAPSAPGNLRLSPSDGQLEASWDAPTTSSDGILSYELSYSTEDNLTNGISISSSEITGTRHPITGLTNDTRYYVWVRAVLDGQEGPWSESVEATPTLPGTPFSESVYLVTPANQDSSWDNTLWSAPWNNHTHTYIDVQEAINAAEEAGGGEVWIAVGSYTPKSKPHNTPTKNHFSLKNTVSVYGGFDGAETTREERDYVNNPVILTGDLAGDDVQGNLTQNAIDNSESVFYHPATLRLSDSALLDGVSIRGGRNLRGAGGGMYNYESSPSLEDVTFESNTANNGGGMYNYESSPSLEDVTFHLNTADVGGGMYNRQSNPSLEDVTFESNTAVRSGGGMHNYRSNPSLENVTFELNTADLGGGMSNNQSDPSLEDVTFESNTADLGGGMSNNQSDPSLEDVTFESNTARQNGGGMSNGQSDPSLEDVTFESNTAEQNGGGMNNYRSHLSLEKVTFESNTAQNHGGGMYNYESSPSLEDVTFESNTAEQNGGGMSNNKSDPSLENVTFELNMAEVGGGMSNDTSRPTLVGVTFNSNTAQWGGGDLYVQSGHTKIFNSLFRRFQITKNSSASLTIAYSAIRGGSYKGGIRISDTDDLENGIYIQGDSSTPPKLYYSIDNENWSTDINNVAGTANTSTLPATGTSYLSTDGGTRPTRGASHP